MVNNIPQIVTHFTDTDLYKLTMAYAIIHCYPRAEVVYEFKDRNNTVYPNGFAELCNEQVKFLETLRFTDEEEAFMKKKCYYIPHWFYTYLKGFRFHADNVVFKQDKNGHLSLKYAGNWGEFVLYEVMLLAIVSELYHICMEHLERINLDDYFSITYEKCQNMFKHNCHVAEFGTRRRMSFAIQETALRAMIAADNNQGHLSGTSNVYLAMKYNLTPIGTHAHEWVAAIAGFHGSPVEANYEAMEQWQKAYDGALGIYLYDTYGFDAFASNFSYKFARAFDGVRVDSGNNYEQMHKICKLYRALGVNPLTKTIMFSNALDSDTAISIQEASHGLCKCGFGIGGNITCDGKRWNIPSANIVIKVVASRITEKRNWQQTCKMSEDKGKFSGTQECYDRFIWSLNSNQIIKG